MTAANLKICLLITKEDKVLLIKEMSSKDNVYKWNVVKGTIEDENILDAASREAQEEVNVKVKLDKSLGVHVKYYGENKYTVYFSYLAEITKGEPKLTSQDEQSARSEDINEVKWFTKDELKQLKQEDFILDVSYFLIKKYLDGIALPLDVVSSQDLSS